MNLTKKNIGVLLLAAILTSLLSYACIDRRSSLLHSPQEEQPVSPFAQKLGYSTDHPLIMGMNTSYAPLQYVDDTGTPNGYDVEFTKELMRRMGIPFAFSPNHWEQMPPNIINGKYGLGMMVYSPYRRDSINYSNAVFRLYYQIVYRKDDYSEFDFRHLKGKRIAYMRSRPIGIMLRSAGADGIAITDLPQAFSELADGMYDGLICYRFQASYNIAQQRLQHFLQADELSLQPREYCYVSENQELIDSINAELVRMKEDGVIDDIYGKEVMSRFGSVLRIPTWVWLLLATIIFVMLIIFSINRYLMSKRLQATLRQLTEANNELQLANKRAEESNQMKATFIKQVSHETRTPLNILNGFTQVLTAPSAALTDEERAEAAEQIQASTKRITELVNKMLELSEINSSTVVERNDMTSSKDIAERAVYTSGISKAPHLTFEMHTEAGADEIFNTNLRSVVRILELLLDNAMKFTHPAESLNTQITEDNLQRAKLTVGRGRFIIEDTGIGIPPSEAEHIFDEFVQLNDYYDGTGIGLTSARNMARQLGGDIIVDTTYTDGARFIFTLEI